MSGTAISITITFSVIVGVACLLVISAKCSKNLPRAAVTGADIIARTFIEMGGKIGDPLLAAVAWMLLSCLLGFGIPLVTGKGLFILEPSQLIIMLDYCVFVPILVGAYIFLIKNLGLFKAQHIRKSGVINPLLSEFGFWTYQLVLLVLTLAIQYQAIHSELDMPSPCSPWVTFDPGGDLLSWPCTKNLPRMRAHNLGLAGVAYYALRGIDTFMALGLVAVLATTWFGAREHFKDIPLIDFRFPGLGPTESARNIGSGLLVAVLCGSIITALHGLSLLAHAKRLGGRSGDENSDVQIQLFTHSTWAIWAILTVIASAMAAGTVLWLRRAIIYQLREFQEREEENYLSEIRIKLAKPKNSAEAKLQADYVEKLLVVRSKIAEQFEKADTWPLPIGALAGVSVALLSQVANVATAVYTFTSNGTALPPTGLD